jgi:hypothetical protein
VILHVARPCVPGGSISLELAEDLLTSLPTVWPGMLSSRGAPCRPRFRDVAVGGAVQNLPGWRAVRRLQRESLLADEAGVQEVRTLRWPSQASRCAGACRGQRPVVGSGSMRCCSQRFCSGTCMFMYSQPILPQ